MIPEIARCALDPATWLFIGPNVPALVYYTHLPNLVISFLLALFVLRGGNRGLPNKILFFTTLAFITWVFFAIIFWASNRSDVIMFAWLMDILVEPLVHIGILYLLYTLIEKRDMPFIQKAVLVALYAPIPIFLSTPYMLSGFDLVNCLATEGPIALYYTYFVEIVATIWLLTFAISRYQKAGNTEKRKEILYLGVGGLLLLLAFSWGNITGSFTENWQLGQYGLFGMPLFIGFLVYSIVKFNTFNMKILGAQALVVTMWFALAAVLVIQSIEYVRIVVSLTLMLFFVVGVFLIRSVKREVEQRERIQKLANELASANDRLTELDQLKSEFISLASHQLRSPLSAIKGYASLILEGSFGKAPAAIEEAVEKIFDSSKHLILVVEDFLNVSRIEQGRMKYDLEKADIQKIVKEVVDQFMPAAKLAAVTLSFKAGNDSYESNVDIGKIKQVFTNLIDNSIKYTPKGNVTVSLSKSDGKIRFVVEDNGVGIGPETLPHLFKKFSRAADAGKVNILGTGLGLYVVKQMVEAHGGTVQAHSDGKGMGSKFTIELSAI